MTDETYTYTVRIASTVTDPDAYATVLEAIREALIPVAARHDVQVTATDESVLARPQLDLTEPTLLEVIVAGGMLECPHCSAVGTIVEVDTGYRQNPIEDFGLDENGDLAGITVNQDTYGWDATGDGWLCTNCTQRVAMPDVDIDYV